MAPSAPQCADTGTSRIGIDCVTDRSYVDIDSLSVERSKAIPGPVQTLLEEGTVCDPNGLRPPLVHETGNGLGINRLRHGVHCGVGGKQVLNQAGSHVRQRVFLVSAAVLSAVLLAASLAGAEAEQQTDLFAAANSTPVDSANRVHQPPPDPLTMRQRLVTIDLVQLTRSVSARSPRTGGAPAAALTSGQLEPGGELRLNLFEDTVFAGIVERTAPTFSGGKSLSGRLVGVEGGTLTLVVNGDVVAGTVRTPEATYRIRPAENGLHTVSQIDPSRLPQLGEPIPQQPPGSDRNPARR